MSLAPPSDTLDPLSGFRTDNKDAASRVRLFARWMADTGRAWHDPDLEAYRDALLASGKLPSSVAAHLSTVRGAYRKLLRTNALRDWLYRMTAAAAPPERRKAFVDEMVVRLQNAIHPDTAPISVTRHQDIADSAELRLTADQASALLAAPGMDTLLGLRDTAVIAVMLCTGVREAELCALDVEDLRQYYGGELSLRIRRGKGNKARLVPWGDLAWALDIVDAWLERAGIAEGAVFRGLFKGGRLVRPGRLTVRTVEYILASYPVDIDGRQLYARPHDCRRTYARRLYEAGMDLVAIQQNLGHADTKTTLRYIGALDARQRRARNIYGFDMGGLGRS